MKNFNLYMKNILLVIPAAILLMINSGCRKELNYTPEVFLSAQQIYKDEPGAIAGVTGIYQQLQTLKRSDYQLIGVIGTDEARCCYQAQGYGAYYQGIVGMDVYDITFNSQNGDVTGFWTVCYQGIANANAAIQYIPQIKNFGDPAVQNRLVGEAKFMRALFYFYLVQLYGDIPLRTETTSVTTGVPRTPQAQVYALIIEDLKFASTNCFTKAKNPDVGRASVEAAKALLGKVYLTMHNYQDAKTTFEDLINNNGLTLMANYADLFDGKHENNAESLFEVQYSTDQAGTSTQGLQNLYGSYAGPPIPFEAFNKNTPGFGGTVVCTTSRYADSLFDKKNDSRYLASVNHDRYDGNGVTMSWWVDPGQPTVKKYDISSSDLDAYDSGKNLYYLRASDVYLMYAEVLNELNQPQAALAPLNKVRERGFANVLAPLMPADFDVKTISQTALRDTIMDERSRELGAEGWRWFDLKRTGTLVSRVKRYDDPKRDFGKANYATDAHPVQNVSENNNLYPIPLSELQNNQALNLKSQNPGY